MSFPGEVVTVRHHAQAGRDPYGAPTTEPEEEEVSNVLVAPGARADLGAERPVGVEIRYTLYFPKTYAQSLEGADINVRGEWLRVVGHPDAFVAAWCPTDWNQVVEVAGTHG